MLYPWYTTEALANFQNSNVGREERHKDKRGHQRQRKYHDFLVPEYVAEIAVGNQSKDRADRRACSPLASREFGRSNNETYHSANQSAMRPGFGTFRR